jgi:serpin B
MTSHRTSHRTTSRRLRATSLVLALGAGLGGALAGCGSSGGSAAVGTTFSGEAQKLAVTTVSAADISAAQTAFGLDLMARRCRGAAVGNDVLSPTSAAVALTMLDTGAAGDTRDRLSRLLHLPTWNTALLAGLQQQHAAFTALKQVRVSNHVYAAVGIKPRPEVIDQLATTQGSDLQTLDFGGKPTEATDAINGQVDKDTRGLIKKLFDSPLDPSTTTVLTNAIYLDAPWAEAFDRSSPGPFQYADGTTKPVTYLEDGGTAAIRSTGGWTSATLDYKAPDKTGTQLQAVVLLPPETGNGCRLPSAAQVAALSTGPSTSGELSMPKLDISQTSDLLGDLAAMGLPGTGDYSGFGGGPSVSRVVQKTVLQVDEDGTKAAAATGVAVATSARAPINRIVANRPYLLLIQDTATHSPLFLARIGNPTSG